MWISSNGASVRLLAKPDQLQNTAGASGDLRVEWKSRSIVPQTLTVIMLYSDDRNIAEPFLMANADVHLGRRPHKHSAAIAAEGSVKVGHWSPQGHGFATVTARAENRTLQHIINPDLADDVCVL